MFWFALNIYLQTWFIYRGIFVESVHYILFSFSYTEHSTHIGHGVDVMLSKEYPFFVSFSIFNSKYTFSSVYINAMKVVFYCS